jgi:predicted transcriptional regulator
VNRQYIVSALKQGFSQTQIAQGLGVTSSAVHQFVEEHGIAAEVAAQSQFMNIDSKMNDLEERILGKLEASVKHAVMDPLKWAHLFKIVNGAKRRSLSEGRPVYEGGSTLVALNLPQRMTIEVTRNQQNEVIEVQGRALHTLPAGKLVEYADKQAPQVASKSVFGSDAQEISYEPIPKSAIAELL